MFVKLQTDALEAILVFMTVRKHFYLAKVFVNFKDRFMKSLQITSDFCSKWTGSKRYTISEILRETVYNLQICFFH